ncbi:hypothetical protein BT69DRAFT_1333000 [Atractiella rhizophila]|nr:hypothetical protein BT69DRAFT_1333000 [Atractiella rhizophila]
MSLPNTSYDYLLLGSSLPISILSASLSSSASVLHLSPQSFYGSQWASLSLPELIQWTKDPPRRVEGVTTAHDAGLKEGMLKKRYALSLSPSIIPSLSPIIQLLISSGVSKYSSFLQLSGGVLFSSSTRAEGGEGTWTKVPMAKEEVFEDQSLSNADRRRVGKFLAWLLGMDIMGHVSGRGRRRETMEEARQRLGSDEKVLGEPSTLYLGIWGATTSNIVMLPQSIILVVLHFKLSFQVCKGHLLIYLHLYSGHETTTFLSFLQTAFSLSPSLSQSLAYAATLNFSSSEPLLPSLLKLHHNLTSIGVYGSIPSPFLVGNYGGMGELVEGFSRSAAVQGAVQVLEARWTISGEDGEGKVEVEVELPGMVGAEAEREKVKVTVGRIVGDEELLQSSLAKEEGEKRKEEEVRMARGIVIIDRPFWTASEKDEDSRMFVFAPEEENGFACTVLVEGQSNYATPAGEYVIYLEHPYRPTHTDQNAQSILSPFLTRLLPSDLTPLFSTFYSILPRSPLTFSHHHLDKMTSKITPVRSYPDPKELVGVSGTGEWAVREVERVWEEVKEEVGREELFEKKEREEGVEEGEEEM